AARCVMKKSRRLSQLWNGIDEEIALGGMQVAARRIHAQRPARAAGLLPRRERERVLEEARQRAQVARYARHRAGRVEAVVWRRAGLVVRREEWQPRDRGAFEAAEGIGLVGPVQLPRAGREAGEVVLRALGVAHDFLKARGVLHRGNMMIQQLRPGSIIARSTTQ